MRKHIIFDFDGVLADSFDVFIESLIEVQPRYFAKRSKDVLENISKNIGLGTLGVAKDKFHDFTQDLRDCYVARKNKINLYHGVKDALVTMKDTGAELGIVSSNDVGLLWDILDRNGLSNHFEFVIGDVGLNRKNDTLASLDGKGVHLEESWYIGDTPHDIKSAKFANMFSAASCWGYTSRELMTKEGPDHYLDEPGQLVEIMEKIKSEQI